MQGACGDCIHRLPTGSRWTGNGFLPACAVVEDGIHKLGLGKQLYNSDGTPQRSERGMLLVEKCYYWQSKEEFEQMEMFG